MSLLTSNSPLGLTAWEQPEAERRWHAWLAAHPGFRRSRGRTCVQRVVGKRCTLGQFGHQWDVCLPPDADHFELFVRGREVIFLSQPYATAEAVRADAEAFAARHGMAVTVSAEASWYMPGATVLIEYRAAVPDAISPAARKPRVLS